MKMKQIIEVGRKIPVHRNVIPFLEKERRDGGKKGGKEGKGGRTEKEKERKREMREEESERKKMEEGGG
jgi:hypothetical protein